MAIIGIVNQKGGCGKSTTAVHFAYWLAQKKGKTVILVDADAQKSSSKWLPNLSQDLPFEVIKDPDQLLGRLPILNKESDFVVADGPGALSEQTKSILFHSDLAVLPIQPTGLDLGATEDTFRLIELVRQVRNGMPIAAAFINRARKRTRLLRETIDYLDSVEGITLVSQVIHQTEEIADAAPAGTVWDASSKAALESAKEFEELFNEISSLARYD